MSGSQRISVHEQLVREHLLQPLAAAAAGHADDALPGEIEQALARAPGPAGLARRGYLGRIAETDLFEKARAPMPGLDELLVGAELVEVALELAEREPLERPEPESGAPSWQVPGPGGHVRHYLALQSVEVEGEADPALKRCWLYGYFVRCCEEIRGDSD